MKEEQKSWCTLVCKQIIQFLKIEINLKLKLVIYNLDYQSWYKVKLGRNEGKYYNDMKQGNGVFRWADGNT